MPRRIAANIAKAAVGNALLTIAGITLASLAER